MRLLVAAVLLPVATLMAQTAPAIETAAGHRLRVVPVADVAAQAVAVVWPHRQDLGADERFLLAQATAAHRALAAQACAGVTTTCEVRRDATVFTGHLSADGLLLPTARAAAADWLLALAEPAIDPVRDADAIDRLRARAALLADDAEWLYPGEVLTTLARGALRSGGDAGAAPAFLQQWTIDALAQAAQAAPTAPIVVVLLGAAADAGPLAACLERIPITAVGQAPTPVRAARVALPVDQPHDRIDAAYAASAGRLPEDIDPLLGAVAVGVLRARAETRFGSYRGNEAGARAPFVQCDPLAGDDLWVCCRRAARHQVGGPRRELDDLLQTLRDEPVTPAEVQAAAAAVVAEWSVPPWSAQQQALFAMLPGSLMPRARALALLLHRGVDDARVAALVQCPPAAVQAVLAHMGDPEQIVRLGLVPTTSPWPGALPTGR